MKFPVDIVAVDERRTALEKALSIIPPPHRAKESVQAICRVLLKNNADAVRPLVAAESSALHVLAICLGTSQGEERYLLQIAQNVPEMADLVAEFAEANGIDTSTWPVEHLRKPHPVFQRVQLHIPALKAEYSAKLDQAITLLDALAIEDTTGALEQLGELLEVFRLRRLDVGLDAFQRFADEPEIDTVLRLYAIRIWVVIRRFALTRPLSDQHRELRRYATYFLAEAYQFSTQGLASDDKIQIREFIASEIAAIRQICKMGDRDAFAKVGVHFQKCIAVAMSLNGLGYGLRQAALCLRYVPEPVIHDDFSFGKNADPKIDAWAAIPAVMVYTLHLYAAKEAETDPLLKDARSQLAEFCLSRLKYDKAVDGGSDQPMEQSEHWRAACISALQDLRSNPQGMGHRTLHWVSEHDPNEHIRSHARSAYTVIRHNAGLGPGASARKTLISAVVWLLSGHHYALGREINYESMSDVILDLVRRTTAPKVTAPST